jgi:hypothetical protein
VGGWVDLPQSPPGHPGSFAHFQNPGNLIIAVKIMNAVLQQNAVHSLIGHPFTECCAVRWPLYRLMNKLLLINYF